MAKGKKRKLGAGDVASNRQASFRYNLLERFECGIVLAGSLGVGADGGGGGGGAGRRGAGGTVARTEDRAFDGEVVGLIGAGAFVAFGDRGEYQGMLPVRRLRGDWWELNDEATILVGTRNGGSIRLGDPITVRVGRIDAPRGRVDLLPADTYETNH